MLFDPTTVYVLALVFFVVVVTPFVVWLVREWKLASKAQRRADIVAEMSRQRETFEAFVGAMSPEEYSAWLSAGLKAEAMASPYYCQCKCQCTCH